MFNAYPNPFILLFEISAGNMLFLINFEMATILPICILNSFVELKFILNIGIEISIDAKSIIK